MSDEDVTTKEQPPRYKPTSVRRFRKVDEAKAKSLREPGRLFIAHGNKCVPAVWSSAIIIVISAVVG